MNRIEKIKNLPYVDLKELTNINEAVEIIYFDSSLEDLKPEDKKPIFVKRVILGSLSIDDKDYDVEELVEGLFLRKLDDIFSLDKEKTINIILEDDIDILNNTIRNLLTNLKKPISREYKSFAFVPKDFDINLDVDSIIKTDKIENEILFGYKTNFDEAGIVVITNEEGLKDNKNIRIGVSDLGFFPAKRYFRIKFKED